MNKILAPALCAFALLASQPVARAADVFSVPILSGQTLSFQQSGTTVNSDGSSSSYGPESVEAHFQAIDVQLLGQHADWRVTGIDSRFTGTYLAQTVAGQFRVSEGNPSLDAVYRYYTTPQPWLYLTQPLVVGQVVGFSGLRRGVWSVPGGGTEAWSGTWSETYTHMGSETITTLLGTFNALKLQVQSVDTVDARALFPNATGRNTWNELRWFVPGFGYVQVQGSGRDETDFNGDGIIDRWQQETQTIVAVPEPAGVFTLLAGLAMLVGLGRRGRGLGRAA